jgi:hypothetical protein
VLAAWCQACRLPEELFTRLAVLARRGDGPVPSWFEDWLEAEGEAQSLRLWSPVLVPGLLQTADYARALFLAGQTDTSEDAIDALVAARLERQVILDRAGAPDVVAVLDEAVLHRLIGSPLVIRRRRQYAGNPADGSYRGPYHGEAVAGTESGSRLRPGASRRAAA